MPTNPLNNAIYFAPLIPNEVLSNTGKGIPCLCDGLPIKLHKKNTNRLPNRLPIKTTKKFKL